MARKSKSASDSSYKNKLLVAALVVCAFLIGLVIPSPFFRHIPGSDGVGGGRIVLMDTANMRLPDGSVYEGSVNARTLEPHGFGVLTKDGSTYEGNWKAGHLPYGKRTTRQSVYEGKFDNNLDNNGFGIIRYTQAYIDGKRRQGKADSEIIATYIGNWKKNVKSGIGRSVMADSTMEFGLYEEGVLGKVDGAGYRVGDKVYGIDVSRHQGNIDWDRLALYCDARGNVFRGKPADMKFMQPVFFVYLKATEGATVKDRTYDVRSVEAERHGIAKGAYHFLRLGSPVESQVDNFVETVNWRPGDLPPALDVEVESEIEAHGVEKLLDMTYTWLEEVERRLGVRPVIYTRESIRDKYLAKDPRFNNYQFWIARYHPDGPQNGELWTLWQMTESGALGGYDGPVDINLYKDDYAGFCQFLSEAHRDSIRP